MAFTFIHAADLHIDSPLESLGAKDPAVAARFADAGRAAVTSLIRETIENRAKFLIIAGDIYDGDWRDVSTGLFFARQLGELFRAGHSRLSDPRQSRRREPDVARAALSRERSRIFRRAGGDEVHRGPAASRCTAAASRSAARRTDFVRAIRRGARAGSTSACCTPASTATRGHDPYAPCTVADLGRFGYDYWALGHIHEAEIVARDPWSSIPAICRAAAPRETGAKGAMRVTVDDGRIVAVEPVALDAARWAHEFVDVAGADDEDQALSRIASPRWSARYAAAGGRPLAARADPDRRDAGAFPARRPSRDARRRFARAGFRDSARIAGSSG